MYNRYSDIDKFITDPDKLHIENGTEVSISSEENYNIVVDLQGHAEEFEQLKPWIVFVTKRICELDNTVQKFDRWYHKNDQQDQNGQFPYPYVPAVVLLDDPYVILEYWGTEENTEFDVVFEYCAEMFTLKSFGTIRNIPSDWEQTDSSETKQIP